LSATQNPIEEVAKYLVGASECGGLPPPSTQGGAMAPHSEGVTIIDEGHKRAMDLALEMPRSPLETVMSHEVWTEYYDRLTELIGAHRTALVIVNTSWMAERVARQLSDRPGDGAGTAHHGGPGMEERRH